MRNYVSLGGCPRQTTSDCTLFVCGYLEFASPRRFSTKKMLAEPGEAKLSTFTLIFQLINIMVYDSYVEKKAIFDKKNVG